MLGPEAVKEVILWDRVVAVVATGAFEALTRFDLVLDVSSTSLMSSVFFAIGPTALRVVLVVAVDFATRAAGAEGTTLVRFGRGIITIVIRVTRCDFVYKVFYSMSSVRNMRTRVG